MRRSCEESEEMSRENDSMSKSGFGGIMWYNKVGKETVVDYTEAAQDDKASQECRRLLVLPGICLRVFVYAL